MNRITLCAVAAFAVASFTTAAFAGGSSSDNEDGQRPPVARDDPPVTREEPAKKECLTDKSGFRSREGQSEFYVELINACDKPLVCVVKAYVIGAEGGKAGSGTLQLAPGSEGQEVHETWTMPTAQNGGMASVSRSCEFKE